MPVTPLNPPLKWAGGKRWQVPALAEIWRPHDRRRLVEPFCGGLAVSLGLNPARALINDVNPHLINFYAWLRKGLHITRPLKNDRAFFVRARLRFNALQCAGRQDCTESAEWFYYLNRTGFNGLCRFNGSGEFNVPFGRYKKLRYTRDFSTYRAVFRRWNFSCADFAELPRKAGDFIYADPPYDVPFTTYAKGGFDWADQVRAAKWVAAHRGPAVLVNQATPRIIELYSSLGFALRFLDAPRRISCTGDRTPAREVLATHNL